MGGGGHNVPFVYDRGRLRKLTERECLRLQGFPEKFSFPDGLPMMHRYRLIGNAVAPPVARIVAEAIKKFMKEAA
jgi:DNA (cytosine-5)-methyltransferase 1